MYANLDIVYVNRNQFEQQDIEMIEAIKEQFDKDKSVLTGLHFAYINMLAEHVK